MGGTSTASLGSAGSGMAAETGSFGSGFGDGGFGATGFDFGGGTTGFGSGFDGGFDPGFDPEPAFTPGETFDVGATGTTSPLDTNTIDQTFHQPLFHPGNQSFAAIGDDELGLDFDAGFKSALLEPVGPDQPNRPQDVYRVEKPLERAGILGRPAGTRYDNTTKNAIKATQDAMGAKSDGLLYPGGHTERRMTAAGIAPRAGFAGVNKPKVPKEKPISQMTPLDKLNAVENAKTPEESFRLYGKFNKNKAKPATSNPGPFPTTEGPVKAVPSLNTMARQQQKQSLLKDPLKPGDVNTAPKPAFKQDRLSRFRPLAFQKTKDANGKVTGLKIDKNIFEATRRKPILLSDHAPDIKSRLYPAPKNEVEAWVRTDRAMEAADRIKRLEAS